MKMEEYMYYNQKANDYLSEKSSEMKALIDLTGPVKTFKITDPFEGLVSQIIYQSISMKAGNTIWSRFKENIYPITPESILNQSYDDIKAIGLSHSKTQYIIHVADAFYNDTINTHFDDLTDDQIITELTKIKGVGEWTAQMMLIFCFERPNVISYKDFGIRKGIEWLFDIDHKLTKEEFQYYKELFSPYATTASHYLWEVHAKTYQNKE
jgi:3-methyladenine DNA glycosylase/8-oxoguanine DNA glycosylase